ncbi:hypothetical protein B597_011440 [Stutzerimonas stutzeri KOS6]|uniref:Uncharacterized protein n=1 Tax=Stutzerimonas stutzeri KOS6 TaxID=1218352 RepID=A0A061JR85_STUST|nr:hypothetical protein B597_011440 [Stutzerimonas stutzeri KOS6]
MLPSSANWALVQEAHLGWIGRSLPTESLRAA